MKKLKYFENSVSFGLVTDCERVINDLEHKLSPFITAEDHDSESIVTLYAFNDLPDVNIINTSGCVPKEIVIDASLYEHLCSKGKRFDINDGEYVIEVEKTQSTIYFNQNSSEIKIYNQSSEALSTDTLRILKSLVSLSCEKEGAVMLHASGVVVGNDQTVLFLGDSRNGKTTILLETLSKFKGHMLSCDTSFVKNQDTSLIVRGWPSNFSVSVGTMHDYEVLHKFLSKTNSSMSYQQAWDIYPKEVLDSKEVIISMQAQIVPEAKVNTLVFLNFDSKGHTRIYNMTEPNSIRAFVKQVYLGSRDSLYPNWHKFWEVSEDDIERNIDSFVAAVSKCEIEVYQMDWSPGPETLLRRVNVLEPFNKNIMQVRDEV